MASTIAEAKLIWYSYHYRDFDRTAQGLIMVEGDRLPRLSHQLGSRRHDDPRLVRVANVGDYSLYQRRDDLRPGNN
jgi:hypothetical protein